MELNGALSNPLESNKTPLERLRCVVRDLLSEGRKAPESRPPLPERPGKIAEAVRAVVRLCEKPARMVEIHTTVESLLGEAVSRGTVKQDLSAGVARGEYVRVGRGLYASR
jgi:hypothetical protein